MVMGKEEEMKRILYGWFCIIVFFGGYISHPKTKIIIKEIPKEVIPAAMQCYNKPLDFSAICDNYLGIVIQKEKFSSLSSWEEGYKQGIRNR